MFLSTFVEFVTAFTYTFAQLAQYIGWWLTQALHLQAHSFPKNLRRGDKLMLSCIGPSFRGRVLQWSPSNFTRMSFSGNYTKQPIHMQCFSRFESTIVTSSKSKRQVDPPAVYKKVETGVNMVVALFTSVLTLCLPVSCEVLDSNSTTTR